MGKKPLQKIGFIIGQAPPRIVADRPFGRTKLYHWFGTIGFDKTHMEHLFDYGSLVAEFPGSTKKGHLPPTLEKMAEHRPLLQQQIAEQHYKVIIPVGKLAIHAVLNDAVDLDQCVGRMFVDHAFGDATLNKSVIIPLPHPSGASTWAYKAGNRFLLEAALALIARETSHFTRL